MADQSGKAREPGLSLKQPRYPGPVRSPVWAGEGGESAEPLLNDGSGEGDGEPELSQSVCELVWLPRRDERIDEILNAVDNNDSWRRTEARQS
jgi:hypothetical protein